MITNSMITVSHIRILKGHESIKNSTCFFFSENCLVMLYICTKFHENISKGLRVTELIQFLISKFSKRHRSVENICGVMILVLNTFSDHALYLYKCHENISKVSEL